MKNYTYQNSLIGKKQLRQLLAWSFTNYDSMQACALADELKHLGFKYASQAGISISIEDLKIPFVKNLMISKANKEIIDAEKIYLKGKITDVERFQKIIDTWSLTSESLKEQVIDYFKNFDPLNSVYIMAFSGARGNLSQVRQLVGMRGLMADPSGEIMKLPIKKNFREGLTITDYLMSGYGARKGIVDTALKTANSGYLTRRLIDVGQDILIREKDCSTTHSFLVTLDGNLQPVLEKILGRVINKPILDPKTSQVLIKPNVQITPKLLETCKEKQIQNFYIRSPLTCNLYRAICQKCYGWDLANENLVDIGEAVGILAGQSIGEPGTQLTMRTFHTGGIFTSEARQQITSSSNGIVRFYKLLKTVSLRTHRGEDVLITKNSGSIILIPEDMKKKLIEIEVSKNTIIFPKNNQYITKDTVLGELVNTNKQIKTEITPILSNSSGEIFMPRLRKKVNLLNNNKLIWILSGKLYNSPKNAFINFYPDYKLNQNSFIFRTKLINHYDGLIEMTNSKLNLYERKLKIKNIKYCLSNSNLRQLTYKGANKNYLFNLENLKYRFSIKAKNSKSYLQLTRHNQIGSLITNSFKTLTGGTIYYDYRNLLKSNPKNSNIFFVTQANSVNPHKSITCFKTITWMEEETHIVNCEPDFSLVEHGDFISEGFELTSDLFSKTSGIVSLKQKNNRIQTISIKSGLLYEGKKLKNTLKKLYFPGEIILSNIPTSKLSFCEHIVNKNSEQLLVRPVNLYEVPYSSLSANKIKEASHKYSNMKLQSKMFYSYKPAQTIKGKKNLELVSNALILKSSRFFEKATNIRISKNKSLINFFVCERLDFNNFISSQLRYKSLQFCSLVQSNQFIDKYTTLGYLEDNTKNSVEIVKFKVKSKDTKQILLISNEDCLTLKKKKFLDKKLNDFVINSSNINETGKIIIENNHILTLQKGRPYYFPNCKNEDVLNKIKLQYKTIKSNRVYNRLQTDRRIYLNYSNILKVSVEKRCTRSSLFENKTKAKVEFSKLFLKKNGKLYSSLMPQFFKKLSLNNQFKDFKYNHIMSPKPLNILSNKKMDRTLLLKSSELFKNHHKDFKSNMLNYQLTLVKFGEYPFTKSNKSIGIYSITEDYFEQDVNSVFCKNSEFIEEGETLGLLNLEKEITGDIVQGLPRIEEILEARKKNFSLKRVPTSQKKGLLAQKTSLDSNLEFKKVGMPINEAEKVNPHKLLKVYFNYYGLVKRFVCDKNQEIKYSRLVNNFEGSYKSFKKVQSFILNSVQSVYKSQGVNINDKHLEVIVKQMTTKVIITYEGNTPLLRREVIDLYHIQYINKTVKEQDKKLACYVPLLLGITKGALNNPSFISAASFQETTRVLTKASIEGRIDWLRGLKENIIIGHLIPSGTGSQNYRNCFKKHYQDFSTVKPSLNRSSNM